MEKKQIPIIIVAIFSISLLLTQSLNVYATEDVIVDTRTGGTTQEDTLNGAIGNIFRGMKTGANSELINQTFNKIVIPLKKTGTLDSDVYIGVWDASTKPTTANAITLIVNFDADDVLTTDFLDYNFTLGEHTIDADEMIGVLYEGNVGGGGSVSIRATTGSSIFDGTDTYYTIYEDDGTETEVTNEDFRLALIQTTGDAENIACIDTSLDGILDLCFTDTNGDGVPDNGQFGSLKAFQSNSNVTQLGTDWFCAFNIGDACTDANVKTNGVGIFYLLILIIFSYAFLVAIHIMAMKASPNGVNVTQALAIHPILLLVMLFIDVGLSWYLGFIEDTVFYSVLVIMVGLGGFGIYRMVTKDN